MNNLCFMAYDADDAGRKIGQSILSDNTKELSEFSQRIEHGNEFIKEWAESHGGVCYSSGGDQGAFSIPPEALDEIEQLRKDYEFATNLTITVGIGNSLSEAGKSLLVGKFRGKNMAVKYDQSIEEEIQEAYNRVKDGTASEEERKLGEAYLNVNESHEDQSQEARDVQYREMDLAPPVIDKPNPKTQPKQEMGTEMGRQEKYNTNNRMLESDSDDSEQQPQIQQNAQSKDDTDAPTENSAEEHLDSALENHKDMMSQMGEVSPTVEQHIEAAIDNQKDMLDTMGEEDLPHGDEMEGNISRPEGYKEQQIPGEMGLSEDEEESPDLSEVLRGGLDNHAESIQKEKITQMVGEALEGFKANKQILEKAKEKAPELYDSCISMLRAMIEMSKMLGLGEEQNPLEHDQSQEEVSQEQSQENKAPAASQEGAAQAPQQ